SNPVGINNFAILDPETGDQIIKRLYEISQQGTAVIVATHNMALLDRYPGRVLRCSGKKLEVN
ncbi:MAG: hypothetical protein K2G07_03385, partial [Muribaculaceae bacterium]|nr:hypothetical protein [Muribaculaceae bacterium]